MQKQTIAIAASVVAVALVGGGSVYAATIEATRVQQLNEVEPSVTPEPIDPIEVTPAPSQVPVEPAPVEPEPTVEPWVPVDDDNDPSTPPLPDPNRVEDDAPPPTPIPRDPALDG